MFEKVLKNYGPINLEKNLKINLFFNSILDTFFFFLDIFDTHYYVLTKV